MPTVSVILPTYNRAYCLRRSIDSVLNQTFTDFELIVINDGSTDDTADLVRSYRDPRLTYVHHNENLGQTERLNEGIWLTQGEFIAFQDSDDEWLPEKLEKQVAVFLDPNQITGIGVVYCDKYRCEPGKEKWHWKSPHNMPEDGIIFLSALDNGVHGIGTQSIMVRKSCFQTLGGFDDQITKSNDWEMLVRISRYYLFHHIPEPLVNYNVTQDSMTATLTEGRGVDAVEVVLNKHRDAYEQFPYLFAQRAYWIGSYHMRAGSPAKGRKYLATAAWRHRTPRYLLALALSLFGQPIYRRLHDLLGPRPAVFSG